MIGTSSIAGESSGLRWAGAALLRQNLRQRWSSFWQLGIVRRVREATRRFCVLHFCQYTSTDAARFLLCFLCMTQSSNCPSFVDTAENANKTTWFARLTWDMKSMCETVLKGIGHSSIRRMFEEGLLHVGHFGRQQLSSIQRRYLGSFGFVLGSPRPKWSRSKLGMKCFEGIGKFMGQSRISQGFSSSFDFHLQARIKMPP